MCFYLLTTKNIINKSCSAAAAVSFGVIMLTFENVFLFIYYVFGREAVAVCFGIFFLFSPKPSPFLSLMRFFFIFFSEAAAVGFGVGKASCHRIWGACGQGEGRERESGEGKGEVGKGGGRRGKWDRGTEGTEGSTCARHDPLSALTKSTHIAITHDIYTHTHTQHTDAHTQI